MGTTVFRARRAVRNRILRMTPGRQVLFALSFPLTIQGFSLFAPIGPNALKQTPQSDLHACNVAAAAAVVAVGSTALVKLVLDRPSRSYTNQSVGDEYDSWTSEGILEHYWGEHIHLGYYYDRAVSRKTNSIDTISPKRRALLSRKNGEFLHAKYDFIDEMMAFGGIDRSMTQEQLRILDVGCGVGGTSRYLAKALPNSQVIGITLSPNQVKRGTELAQNQGVKNVNFRVLDALNMTEISDSSVDIVWACESGEHMPNKTAYINEMVRVLRPGGKFVMACWCQRDDRSQPFDERDRRDLDYLYREWTHPYFVSVQHFSDLIRGTGVMENIKTDNWVDATLPSWRHSILVGVIDPFGWIFKPRSYVKCVRDAYCLERMHRAFGRGLMEYGMFAATKTCI